MLVLSYKISKITFFYIKKGGPKYSIIMRVFIYLNKLNNGKLGEEIQFYSLVISQT